MTDHPIAGRAEWQAARDELLALEKEHTRMGDELARRRRELPWVRVEKEYRFDTDAGTRTLAELFDGRSQLFVYHFMFGPRYEAGCPVCSSSADAVDGVLAHLHARDVTMLYVSRAPLETLQAYKRRMGWRFPWVSSAGSDFNFDFNISFTEEQQREKGIEYNFQREPKLESRPGQDGGLSPVLDQFAKSCGTDAPTFLRDRPGMSTFVREDDAIYHTYSTFARGLDGLWNMYQWLDRAPLGRNEKGIWWRRHDEYAKG